MRYIPEAHHCWDTDTHGAGLRLEVNVNAPGPRRLRELRPPIVVRVWPDRRWEVVPLGHAQFPEGLQG